MTKIDEAIEAWDQFVKTITDWHLLVQGAKPRPSGCGLLYELENPIDRPNENLAIADMRQLGMSEPHKHINDETEIYFILEGAGKIGLGDQTLRISKGDVIVIPPETIHITIPDKELILAAVTSPPFNQKNYVRLSDTSKEVLEMIGRLKAN